MLTIKQVLAINPEFILSVNYDAGSIGEMVGEPRDLNLYLAEMTIQYHSLLDDACLAFSIECLVSLDNNVVTIDEMNTSDDAQSVYIENIEGLPNSSVDIWGYNTDSDLHELLKDLIENQPIYDTPDHYTINAY